MTDKLKLELFKLKAITKKRHRQGASKTSYSDVVWFLLDYYKKNEEAKKLGQQN